MKILVVSPLLPYPPDSGGSIRIYNFIRNLSKDNDVDVISMGKESIDSQSLKELGKYCNNVHLSPVERKSKFIKLAGCIYGLTRGEPIKLKSIKSHEFSKLLHEITSRVEYDIIQFEHSESAFHLDSIKKPNKAKTVLVMHNVVFLQFYRIYKNEKKVLKRFLHFLRWFPMFSWEQKKAGQFDKVLTVSESDKQVMQVLEPSLDISVVPNGVDTKTILPFEMENRKKTILFVGLLNYPPNVDAVVYFCSEIFPLIKANNPGIELKIVGKSPSPEILKLNECESVEVHPNVKDVSPFYQECFLSIVPLRSGGGTRLKILESMAFGAPVVSTNVGCEGLEVTDMHDILIVNDAKEFARTVIDLIDSPGQAFEISKNARKFVEENYDWAMLTEGLMDAYNTEVAKT